MVGTAHVYQIYIAATPEVRLVHGDLAYSPLTWAHVEDGWVWVIDALKTLLETGKSLPGPEVESAVSATPEDDWHRRQGVEDLADLA